MLPRLTGVKAVLQELALDCTSLSMVVSSWFNYLRGEGLRGL